MILVAVVCSVLTGSCTTHQIPLSDEITTPQACAGAMFTQQVLAEFMQAFPNHEIRRVACMDASNVDKDI